MPRHALLEGAATLNGAGITGGPHVIPEHG